jgi:hypothetical protein
MAGVSAAPARPFRQSPSFNADLSGLSPAVSSVSRKFDFECSPNDVTLFRERDNAAEELSYDVRSLHVALNDEKIALDVSMCPSIS